MARGRSLVVSKGAVIVREGEPVTCAYGIVSGRVAVSTERSGRSVLLARLGPGEFFGEMSLVTEAARTATVVATQECVLRPVTRQAFDRLLLKDPKRVIPLIKALVNRLRLMNLKYLMLLESQPRLTSTTPPTRHPTPRLAA